MKYLRYYNDETEEAKSYEKIQTSIPPCDENEKQDDENFWINFDNNLWLSIIIKIDVEPCDIFCSQTKQLNDKDKWSVDMNLFEKYHTRYVSSSS